MKKRQKQKHISMAIFHVNLLFSHQQHQQQERLLVVELGGT